ncbi:hypothetical protein MRB53_034643 [Persea americana]|uniref:Uncharacterized protein n=1 Tax=Persea americana TaxID=3435 RepID=A0ACC2K2B3_PERAE|nr:hypothetical protein MRB53_034643 [Persea americana]
MYCINCDENVAFENGDDGFFYCHMCGSQSQDVVDTTGLGDHLFLSGIYNRAHMLSQPKIKTEPWLTQTQTQFFPPPTITKQEKEEEQKPYSFEDESFVPLDFGNPWMNQAPPLDDETVVKSLRLRYVQGIQVMIQLQCQVLVERFSVSPAICGLSGALWLRYISVSRVFDKDWAKDTILDSEEAFHGRVDATQLHMFEEKALARQYKRHKEEPRNTYGQRSVVIWCKFLKRRIPLHTSLTVCFLACHIAREAILPTDISKWAREGKLPYMSAFVSLEKYIGGPSRTCPLSSRILFRPRIAVEPMLLETHAATVAEHIGLLLPPVNFHAIARRYLEQLSLPTEKILSHASHIYEWSMPPDLWLSTNIGRLPTRVCVMSILIVAIRILYNINGHGKWEASFPNQVPKKLSSSLKSVRKVRDVKESEPIVDSCDTEMDRKPSRSSSPIQISELDTTELLCHLEKAYDKLADVHDYSKDLLSYLKYCKDVVFAGLTTSFEEDNFIEQLWNLYETQEDIKPSVEPGTGCCIPKRSRDEGNTIDSTDCQQSTDGPVTRMKSRTKGHHSLSMDDDINNQTWMSPKEEALRQIKSDMELDKLHYLPPRSKSKNRSGYVCYARKAMRGKWNYVADADYYILLRTCARLTQIDIRVMHLGALKLEKRLLWIEKRVDDSLRLSSGLSSELKDKDFPDCDDMLD